MESWSKSGEPLELREVDAFERLTSKQIIGNGDCTRDLYYHSSPFLAGRGDCDDGAFIVDKVDSIH